MMNPNEIKKKSLRQIGKEDIKKYYNAPIRKIHDALILLVSLVLTGIVFLPLILLFIQLFGFFNYLNGAVLLLILVAIVLLMLMNGVSNFFQIRLAQVYLKEESIKEINPKAIFIYQTTNFGFFIFLLFVSFLTLCSC